MKFNRFFWIVLFRVVFIAITAWGFVYLYTISGRIFTSMLIAALCIFQVVLLVNYVNKTNRDLARFLMYFKEMDTSLVFDSGKIEKTFKDLNHSFKEVNAEIRKVKIDKEYKDFYFKYLISNIGVGIISTDENENVKEYNDAARNIFSSDIRNLKVLKIKDEEFYNKIVKLRPGKSQMLRFCSNNKTFFLSVNKSVFIIAGKKTILLSFQNIESELAEKELESWQKLIRVLTHEIMNSVTPITTTATAIKRFFRKDNQDVSIKDVNQNIIDDTLRCIKIIEDRGTGLIDFVNNYKSLTQLPEPKIKTVIISELFNDIVLLLKDDFEKNSVQVSISINENLTEFKADRKLIEQVLINLIRNSIESFDSGDKGKIVMSAGIEKNSGIFIKVKDNGPGIPPELHDKIFIPFYTSKKMDDGSGKSGSGIGLSISKQIMQLHAGNISVQSEPGFTEFTLRF